MRHPARASAHGRQPLARPPGGHGATWLARLQASASALAGVPSSRQVLAAIAGGGCRTLPGACACVVATLSDDGAATAVEARAAPAEERARVRRLPPASETAVAGALTDGGPRFAPDRAASDRLLPRVGAALGRGVHAIAALPLALGERRLGGIAIGMGAPHAFDEDERALLAAFAERCADAVVRTRQHEADRAARLDAERAAEAARRAAELQERLVGVVGHDLRTPLAAVHMAAALLARERLTATQARNVERIGAGVARMTALVRDLLDFARVRREGRIPLDRRPVDLHDVARRVIAELEAAHARTVVLEEGGPAPVIADADRLAQVVSNLVGNALQHGPRGAPVRVGVRADRDGAALEVHNAGPAIPAALLPELFEPFRRGTREADAGGSVGLGLFIVREIVRAHGGEVSVRSSDAGGTTFTVRLASGGASTGRPAPND